jgi:hypothetical protein
MPVEDKNKDVEMTDQIDSKADADKKVEKKEEVPNDKFYGKLICCFYY